MKQAMEMTTFTLNGCTCAEFVAANAGIDQWLRRQPGFQSRHLAERGDGSIVDMLLWDSVAQGTAAMHRLMDELGDSPVHGMIDQRSAAWSIAPVRHQLRR